MRQHKEPPARRNKPKCKKAEEKITEAGVAALIWRENEVNKFSELREKSEGEAAAPGAPTLRGRRPSSAGQRQHRFKQHQRRLLPHQADPSKALSSSASGWKHSVKKPSGHFLDKRLLVVVQSVTVVSQKQRWPNKPHLTWRSMLFSFFQVPRPPPSGVLCLMPTQSWPQLLL